MVDWAYVCGMADDTGNDPDHDEHQDPEDLTGCGPSKGRHFVYGPKLSCNRCGESDVFWMRVKGRHMLYGKETIEPHVCPTSADGFEEAE